MRIACYAIQGHGKARLTCAAMVAGINRAGDTAVLRADTDHRAADCDAAVFWGYIETCQQVMRDYRAAGKPVVYLDMGYWQREGNAGFFKVAVNARHPTAYFQRVKHDGARARMFGVTPQPWRSGRHILIAGMSAKAAWAEKLEPAESFERGAIAALMKVTARPVVYRPKPSWKQAQPFYGYRYSPPDEPLADVLRDAHAVVTHHSNVAVDGLVAGVPAFVWDGVAVPMGSQDLSMIEQPARPDDRAQWINDVAYTQWSMAEMADGSVWRHLKHEGLV